MKLLRSRSIPSMFPVFMTMVLAIGLWIGSASAASAATPHMSIKCGDAASNFTCTEVHNPEEVFGKGHYVGHDEPSTLFYSNTPGAGNRNLWTMRLPKDPPGNTLSIGKAYNFQLHPAFWFGMAMCDTQSYPEQVSTCTPDSDSNIVDPAVSPKHPGTAFTELQFYPPGGVLWPSGNSCDSTQWCAALNIDSLSEDPVNGTTLNPTCASITGLEYVNFAFITKNGVPQAPANPVQSNLTTFTADPAQDLFMRSGDVLVVTMHDSAHGLRVDIIDATTGQRGSMTASATNGFGQVKFAPSPSTECTNIPYDFHPMYSTSSEQTRVPWAAHSYNVAFSDEIGHFDNCFPDTAIVNGICSPGTGTEGVLGDQEPAEGVNNRGDDVGCFPTAAFSRVQVSGCYGTNTGFDGYSYQKDWPDGNTALHPEPVIFTSPLTGEFFTHNYNRMAFEADLPAIEANAPGGVCSTRTGAGCTLIPPTDDGTPANFYPFFSSAQSHGVCAWLLGNDVPGLTSNDFGKNNQYGSPVLLDYLAFGGGGSIIQRFEDFRQVMSSNPCTVFSSARVPMPMP